MQVTLNLPENLYRRAERLAQLTGQDIKDVIANRLDVSLPPLNSEMDDRPIETLSDSDVLALSESMMDENLNSRMSLLLQKQQDSEINDAEGAELKMLMELFEVGQLRKAQALVESVKRGLHDPLLALKSLDSLSDEEVLKLANLQMESTQDQRLSDLLYLQQARDLNETERVELETLMQIYQAGLLRKAYGLRVAVQRGLREPLEP